MLAVARARRCRRAAARWRSRAAITRSRTALEGSGSRPASDELERRHRLDLADQVDPVEQRPAEPRAIARAVGLRCSGSRRAAARTGSGCRRRPASRSAGNTSERCPRVIVDPSLLERLPQRVERRARELRQLVEEQHAAVRERDLARPRHARRRRPGPTREIVWCGARNGRSAPSRPSPMPADAVDLRDLERLLEARAAAGCPGRRRASIVLPAPGGPTMSRLWPPAAAISSARFASCWPRTSARSRLARRRSSAGAAAARDRVGRPLARAAARRSGRGRRRRSPRSPRRAPPRPRSRCGTIRRSYPAARAPSAAASAPRTGRELAAQRQLAADRGATSASAGTCPLAAEQPHRDREVEARARLAHVRGREVGGQPLHAGSRARSSNAPRAPARAPRAPPRSGSPTSVNAGQPRRTSTSTVTSGCRPPRGRMWRRLRAQTAS